jgi:hypothetical protein
MSLDISPLLESWDYQPGKLQVRSFRAKDGTDKIQLRIDLGVMQMNASGRPDGRRPFGRDSLLDHLEERAEQAGGDFKLTTEEVGKLSQEAVQFHHRYICWFQMNEYRRVIEDAEHNMELFAFATEHTPAQELLNPMRVIMPQLLMLHTRSRASLAIDAKNHAEAVAAVEEGVEAIATYFREQNHPELVEHSGEIHSLREWAEELRENRPMSQREKLEKDLSLAIQQEDYEKAAQVRDMLRQLQ